MKINPILFGMIISVSSCTNDNKGNMVDNTTADAQTGQSLTCANIVWCTNWSPSDTALDVPDLQGGTLSDGLYRAKQAVRGPKAFLVDGDQILEVTDFVNRLGTWRVMGNELKITYNTVCSADYTDPSELVATYRFAVVGDELYLQSLDCVGSCKVGLYTQVSGLCEDLEWNGCGTEGCVCATQRGFDSDFCSL